MPPPSELLLWLFVTWLVEWAVAAVVLRRSDWWLAYFVFLVNALTHPLANLAVLEWEVDFTLVEVLVCLVEWPLYSVLLQISWRKGLTIAVLANLLTALLSFVLPGSWLFE